MSFYPSGTGNYSAKTKKRAKYGIVASAIIVLLVMSFMLSRPLIVDPLPNKINVILTAQVFRDGELIAERIKDDDLLLNNFINATSGLFGWAEGGSFSVELYSGDEMSNYDFMFWNETAGDTVWDTSQTWEDHRIKVDYGTATNPPARDDDGMDQQIHTEIDYDVLDIDTDSFTLTFLWTCDDSETWSETALHKFMWSDDFAGPVRIYLVRDTFTPISVELGDTLVTNYQFTFSSGYTENAIKIFYTWLIGANLDLDTTVSLTDNTNTARTVRFSTNDMQDTEFYGHVGNSNNGGWIIVSDSSSGIPSRSAYRLLGSNVLINSVAIAYNSPSYEVTVSAVLIPSSAITVRASGVFMYSTYVGGSDAYFLVWALSHSGVYVAENTPVKATFTLEL